MYRKVAVEGKLWIICVTKHPKPLGNTSPERACADASYIPHAVVETRQRPASVDFADAARRVGALSLSGDSKRHVTLPSDHSRSFLRGCDVRDIRFFFCCLASSSLGFNLISDRTIRLFEGDSAQKT
jgi:hypothetical protein